MSSRHTARAHQKSIPEHVWVRMFRQDAVCDQRGRCWHCGAPISVRTATADHLKPRKNGGTTERKNIGAACDECNAAKGCMADDVFRRQVKHPSRGAPLGVWLAHFRFRLWRRTHRACDRIKAMVA